MFFNVYFVIFIVMFVGLFLVAVSRRTRSWRIWLAGILIALGGTADYLYMIWQAP